MFFYCVREYIGFVTSVVVYILFHEDESIKHLKYC